jgi:hypothetical protein
MLFYPKYKKFYRLLLAHHFKCHSARACHTWAKGGPIKDDKISYIWGKKAFGEKK